jgi:hypothetical protein
LNHELHLLNNGIKIEFIPPLDIPMTFHNITYNDILPSKDPSKLKLLSKMKNMRKLRTIFVNFETVLKQIENIQLVEEGELQGLGQNVTTI